jgi:chemotaxis protein CheX
MITPEDIHAVTENVFSTMLGSTVEMAENTDQLADRSPITGCVHIAGEWTGAVMVQTTGELATFAACRIFALEEDEVQKNDCQDTMAEIANMIGGNIKSLVPGPSVLSLPTVTMGKEFDIRIFGTEIQQAVPMQCNGQELRVVICAGIS